MIIRKAIVAGALLVAGGNASATLDWGWSFTPSDTGLHSKTETVFGRATLFNSSSSTETLDFSQTLFGFGVQAVYRNGVNTPSAYNAGFGHAEPPPWPVFSAELRSLVLAPGQSHSTYFVYFAPSWDIQDGHYSVEAQVRLCVSDICRAEGGMVPEDMWDSRKNTLTWTVSSVPEGQTYHMLLLGLAAVGFVSARHAKPKATA